MDPGWLFLIVPVTAVLTVLGLGWWFAWYMTKDGGWWG